MQWPNRRPEFLFIGGSKVGEKVFLEYRQFARHVECLEAERSNVLNARRFDSSDPRLATWYM